MHERLKASEVGQIEKNFEIFFMESYPYIYFELFLSFQPFSYYKKCAYLKEVIRWDSDLCSVEMF